MNEDPTDASETEPVLASALDDLGDVFYVFDSDGGLQRWNDRFAEVAGYTDDELAGMTLDEFVAEVDRAELADYLETVREDESDRFEAEFLNADGESIPYEFISKPVTDDEGEVVGRVGIGRDVSAQQEYRHRIERHNERLEQFAEVLSHDLRNPLAIARGNLDLYARTGDDEYHDKVDDALDRLEELITDVLAMARDGEDIGSHAYDTPDLATVAESAWSLVRTDGATLAVEETATLHADASRLQQILENLFRNTVEHGKPPVTVRVGLLPDGFYVEDDGDGIPPDERDKVFDAGYSTKDRGTGFGLASVEQIVDGHGWDVEITEGRDGGARFEITGL